MYFKGTQVANAIRDEDHAGDGNVQIIDAFSDESALFFEALGDGGSSEDLAEASDESDDAAEVKSAVLYKVSANADEEVEVSVIGEKPLSQSMLDQDVSILLLTNFCLLTYVFKFCFCFFPYLSSAFIRDLRQR